jgi:purine-nucleoside phosphorylase
MSGGVAGPPDRSAESAAAVVRTRSLAEPRAGVVLGSGLGPALGEALQIDVTIPYADLPGFPAITVPGHVGELVLGELAGVPIAGFRGRFHLYEGHDPEVPALLPRLAHALGATTMVLTAAVGAVVPGLAAGTAVILRDHLNFTGAVPLLRWRFADGSPAFVSGEVYDAELRELALARAGAIGVNAVEGVYGAMRGPAYETPAEVEMLARAGATVVGMSMVPESLPAHALGMRVLGICSLTNALGEPVTHEDVLRVSHETAAAIGRLLVDLLPRLPRKELHDG